MKVSTFSCLLLLASSVSAWTVPEKSLKVPTSMISKPPANAPFDPLHLAAAGGPRHVPKDNGLKALVLSSAALGTPTMASAATVFTPNAIPSALAAYGHYISLLGILACLMIERLTIKPNMSEKEEDLVALADTGLYVNFILYLSRGCLGLLLF